MAEQKIDNGSVALVKWAVRGATLGDLRALEARFWAVTAERRLKERTYFQERVQDDMNAEERAGLSIESRFMSPSEIVLRAEEGLAEEGHAEELAILRADLRAEWSQAVTRNDTGRMSASGAAEAKRLWDRLYQQADYALISAVARHRLTPAEHDVLTSVWV